MENNIQRCTRLEFVREEETEHRGRNSSEHKSTGASYDCSNRIHSSNWDNSLQRAMFGTLEMLNESATTMKPAVSFLPPALQPDRGTNQLKGSRDKFSRMFVNFRRFRKCQCVQLVMTCLVLSVVMVCWERLDSGSVSYIKSYSFRHLINHYASINKSFTIPRQEAHAFSNYRYLLNHPFKCSEDGGVLLLLLVKSSPENFERRQAIRSTWGNETYIRQALGATVKVVFVLGLPKPQNPDNTLRGGGGAGGVQDDLVREDGWHGDLVQQDFVDTFHNLTLKLLLQFRWAHTFCPHARFLMTADDDIFVHMPNVVSYLKDRDSKGVSDFWVGRVHRGAPPIRRKESKYYVSPEMYPWASYPDYTAGAGYVFSRDVADKIYQASLTLNASLYIDDVFMGICASAMGVSPQEHVYFSGEGKAPYHTCIFAEMMTSHGHVDDIYQLWNAATSPEVKQVTSGLLGRLYCTAVKLSLLCRPYYFNTYPCKAAFM
ncbi:hypothetical protein UPYG_G00299900 [Umbra pygmaea]|uniref:Hexosyltransferase n=1 Tax=Umbra pygmaea TaxID=75934 RepID=A0ABD0WAJ5_UMBPY